MKSIVKSVTAEEESNSESQAKAQLSSIREMVAALDTGTDEEREEAAQTIQEDVLSVEVRSDWHTPGETDFLGGQYNILLCTGGPAVRIIGNLNEHNEPETATLEHQDWGTPWTEYRISSDEEADVVRYAQQFYFGE